MGGKVSESKLEKQKKDYLLIHSCLLLPSYVENKKKEKKRGKSGIERKKKKAKGVEKRSAGAKRG
jgi:hypothetical protein